MRLVGLDIGSRFLRALALDGGPGRWRVVGHAAVERVDDRGEDKPLGRALLELDQMLPLRGVLSVASSDLATMVRFEHNVPMPPERLRRVLRMELVQHAGDGGDLCADAIAVPLDGEDIIHCCGLAQPAQVHALLAELRVINREPDVIQLPAAALANALPLALPPPPAEPEAEEALRLIIDLGAARTRVVLARGAEFLACRELALGAERFLEAQVPEPLAPVAASSPPAAGALTDPGLVPNAPVVPVGEAHLHSDQPAPEAQNQPIGAASAAARAIAVADADEAADFLRDDPADDSAAAAPADAPASATDDPLAESGVTPPGSATLQAGGRLLGSAQLRVAEDLHAQLVKTILWFRAQLKRPRLEASAMELCGGGASLPGLAAYLERRTGRPVRAFSPLAGLPGAPEGPVWAAALGLALSGAPAALRLELTPESIQYRRLLWRHVVWPWVAAALLLIAALLASIATIASQRTDVARRAVYANQQEEHQRLLSEFARLEQERDGLRTDLRAVASRLFGGRDLLYLIRALKEQAPEELWIQRLGTRPQRGGEAGLTAGAPGLQAGGRRPISSREAPVLRAPAPGETIDRGSVWLEGFVRPEVNTEFSVLYERFNRWYNAVLAWESPRGGTLLRDFEFIQVDFTRQASDDEGRFPFSLRFGFRPTEIEEVSNLVEEAPGGSVTTGSGPSGGFE